MGDIIESTVAAFQPLLYYKVSDSGIWFDVKTQNKALVGLAKDSRGRCQYWCEISNPGTIKILKGSDIIKSKADLEFVLSENNYSRFWITWNSDNLRAGIGNTENEVIICPITSKLNCITFTTRDPLHLCTVKFAVPPLCLTAPPVLSEPRITAGKLQWKPCDDQLPDGAVIGGYIDGEIVYVIRAHHRQSLTPGVFVPSKGLAFIPWGGSDNPTSNFEALCGFNLIWKRAFGNRIPVDAFVAGFSEDRHEPLYIGRALYESSQIPGKVQLSHRVCYVTFQGREIAVKNFEVLTEPGLNGCCANEFVEPQFHFVDLHNENDMNFNDDDMSEDEEIDNDGMGQRLF